MLRAFWNRECAGCGDAHNVGTGAVVLFGHLDGNGFGWGPYHGDNIGNKRGDFMWSPKDHFTFDDYGLYPYNVFVTERQTSRG